MSQGQQKELQMPCVLLKILVKVFLTQNVIQNIIFLLLGSAI